MEVCKVEASSHEYRDAPCDEQVPEARQPMDDTSRDDHCDEDAFVSILTKENPAKRDGEIYMLEETHTYYIDGKPCRTSCTGLLKKYFPLFDAEAIVERYFDKWKGDKSSKYGFLIDYLQKVEKWNDAFCKKAIIYTWRATGEHASEEGTAMHRDFQYIVERLPPPQGETNEVVQFRGWLSNFCTTYGLKPWRAEWNIYFTHPNGCVVVAGQVDLVLQSMYDPGEFFCVDYKRTDPQPKKAGDITTLLGDEPITRYTEWGAPPLAKIPATGFGKYSIQQNVYGYIAATQYGVDFRDRMYLLQVHPSLSEPHLVGVERLDEEMEKLFANECKIIDDDASNGN